eukprot:2127122-Amphidinium_carterae.1
MKAQAFQNKEPAAVGSTYCSSCTACFCVGANFDDGGQEDPGDQPQPCSGVLSSMIRCKFITITSCRRTRLLNRACNQANTSTRSAMGKESTHLPFVTMPSRERGSMQGGGRSLEEGQGKQGGRGAEHLK